MLDDFKKIYDALPARKLKFLKHIPDQVLFGFSYTRQKKHISFDKDIFDENIKSILEYAREHTGFGRDYVPARIYKDEAKSVLGDLPLISSKELSDNLDYFISDEYGKRNSYLTTTGGSGRNPTSILLSNESFGIEWAHMHHIWSYAGYRRRQHLKLTLRGKAIKSNDLLEYNPLYNEIIADTFCINRSNVAEFIEVLQSYDVKYIHGYPSLVKEFMEYFEECSYRPSLKGVFLGSEGCTPEEKKRISEFFKAPVIHWYGQSEKVALAVDENMDGFFRVYSSYGYPRIVEGEIVATTFVNRAMPLVNFRTGDGGGVVERNGSLYLSKIGSRWGKDFVYLNSGKKIPTAAINIHSAIQNEILFYQIHQKEYGKLEFLILPKLATRVSHERIVAVFLDEMRHKLKDFIITGKIVSEDEIVRSHRGKMILLVQDLKPLAEGVPPLSG